MYQSILQQTRIDFDRAFGALKEEVVKIRTGRASGALVEDIKVECYGGIYTIKEIAVISMVDPRTIRIEPWDKSIIPDIERALASINFGSTPSSDRDGIRISLPPLSEESRRDFVRLLRQKLEETRQAIRKIREETWRTIQDVTKEGKIREDDKFRAKDELQKLVDEYNEKIENLSKKKEEEIMTS